MAMQAIHGSSFHDLLERLCTPFFKSQHRLEVVIGNLLQHMGSNKQARKQMPSKLRAKNPAPIKKLTTSMYAYSNEKAGLHVRPMNPSCIDNE